MTDRRKVSTFWLRESEDAQLQDLAAKIGGTKQSMIRNAVLHALQRPSLFNPPAFESEEAKQ